jgi:hypothetical protein
LVLSQTPDVPPQLTITQTNCSVTISWPSAYFDWVLAATSSLAGNSVWVAVPATEYQTNGSTTSIGVIQPPGSSFYRLQKAPD